MMLISRLFYGHHFVMVTTVVLVDSVVGDGEGESYVSRYGKSFHVSNSSGF